MGSEPGEVYTPIPENVAAYEELFQEYKTLHDYFGRGSNDVMHRLKAIQRKADQGRGSTGQPAGTDAAERNDAGAGVLA
jgi:L-ribulokinase